MSALPAEFGRKKAVVKDIILALHQGLSLEQARARLEAEVGAISSSEIAEIEQSLIAEGMAPDEIKKFCNVHALLFQASLRQAVAQPESPAHPVRLFQLENRAIEQITAALRSLAAPAAGKRVRAGELRGELERLRGLDIHYTRKEQVLFPYLERHNFFGPSKVMWGKDNEIRDLLREALASSGQLEDQRAFPEYVERRLKPLLAEIEGMIFKEEQILFPAALEKLSADEWVEILRESEQVGYVLIKPPGETAQLIQELARNLVAEPEIEDRQIRFPTGALAAREVMYLLNTLPIDITFVDRDDTVRYFSDSKSRVFVRTKSVIGRKVQNCHPPQSVETVEKILNAFRAGSREVAEFWINYRGKFLHIRYFALRDALRQYLGTLEVTQDVTALRQLEGEKRLLDEKN